MTDTLQRIYARLRPLQFYQLQCGSRIDCELAAYDAAFSVLETALADVAAQTAVQTAAGDALIRYEQLVGLTPRLGLSVEARRALVLYRMGSAPFDFNRTGMLHSVLAAGMEATFEEDLTREKLIMHYVRVLDQTLDFDSIKVKVRTMLPAHLESEFDMGYLTWDMLEEFDPTWNALDALDCTWTEFDFNGHELLA